MATAKTITGKLADFDAEDGKALQDALPEELASNARDEKFSARLGAALGRQKDRRYGGYHLQRHSRQKRAARWSVAYEQRRRALMGHGLLSRTPAPPQEGRKKKRKRYIPPPFVE